MVVGSKLAAFGESQIGARVSCLGSVQVNAHQQFSGRRRLLSQCHTGQGEHNQSDRQLQAKGSHYITFPSRGSRMVFDRMDKRIRCERGTLVSHARAETPPTEEGLGKRQSHSAQGASPF